MSMLTITDLHACVITDEGETPILRGVSLVVESGKTNAIMGPNGSGKSTLAYVIAGHPKYTVTSGSIDLDGEDVLAQEVAERADGAEEGKGALAIAVSIRHRHIRIYTAHAVAHKT